MVNVVAALIFKGDKFLICQRNKNKARALLWEFVGGKVEVGESEEQALIRECKEELDIEVKPRYKLTEVVHTYPDLQVKVSLFVTDYISGEIKMIEHNDIKFITKEELDNYSFCEADYAFFDSIKELK